MISGSMHTLDESMQYEATAVRYLTYAHEASFLKETSCLQLELTLLSYNLAL